MGTTKEESRISKHDRIEHSRRISRTSTSLRPRLSRLADIALMGSRSSRIDRLSPRHSPAGLILRFRSRPHLIGVSAMCADMLFHIILSGEGLIADGAMNALFAGMLLAMTGGMAGGGEGGSAPVAGGIRTRVLILSACVAGLS